jgi:hypothetical protein
MDCDKNKKRLAKTLKPFAFLAFHPVKKPASKARWLFGLILISDYEANWLIFMTGFLEWADWLPLSGRPGLWGAQLGSIRQKVGH